nr:methyl-accepting chemotaxis protein [Desulfitobacterium hafniense]
MRFWSKQIIKAFLKLPNFKKDFVKLSNIRNLTGLLKISDQIKAIIKELVRFKKAGFEEPFPSIKFKDWKMVYKINLLVLFLALFMGIIGFTGYYYYQKANNTINQLYEQTFLSIQYLNTANESIKANQALTLELVAAPIDKIREQQIINETKKFDAQFDEAVINFQGLASQDFEQEKLTKLVETVKEYRAKRQEAVLLYEAGDKLQAYNHYAYGALIDFDVIKIILTALVEFNSKEAELNKVETNNQFHKTTTFLFVLPVIAVVLAILLGILLARMIAKPMQNILNHVQEISRGNLKIENLSLNSRDEVGELANAFDVMLTNLRHFVLKTAESGQQLTSSVKELGVVADINREVFESISAAINEVASGAEKQTLYVDETFSAIQQISASIQHVTDNSIYAEKI